MTNDTGASLVRDGERLDDLQLGGLEIIQDPNKFCFGVDAVFLSDFARVKPGGDRAGYGHREWHHPAPPLGKDTGQKIYRA